MKCIWCNKPVEDGGGLEVKFDYSPGRFACSEACRKEYNRFALYVFCNRLRYIGLVLAVCTVGVAVTFIRMKADYGALGTFICLSGLGAVIYKYPFTTPQFVEDHGGRYAVSFAKRASIYLMVSGIMLGLMLYIMG